MIKISAWQRLCVYSPEVTGSCLLTSVASTMEPRKVRKLKVLTGFRPVSDQFHTLRPAASKPWRAPAKKRTKRETQRKKERHNTKTRLLSMSKSIVKGKVKEPKASKECLNWIYLRYEKFWDPGAGVPKHCKEGGASSGTANAGGFAWFLACFRPVSHPSPSCLKTMARLCKRKEQREKHKGRKKEIIQKPDCCQCQSQKLKEK